MDNSNFLGLLTLAVFLPTFGALLLAIPIISRTFVKRIALSVVTVELLITVFIFVRYYLNRDAGLQMVDRLPWIPIDSFPVEYFLGIDGLSAPMVLLTGILGFVAIFASWNVTHRVKEHFAWLLILQTGVMGVFTSLDFFLFFLFWEIELIPMFFLIAIWGTGRKEYSAMKFLIFTLAGSAAMLLGILLLMACTNSLDMTQLPEKIQHANLLLPATAICSLLFLGFAVKLPVWPFHTWLPDAHTDAPTAASVMLAGVLLKMGGYGIFRVCVSMFPDVAVSLGWAVASLGVINIIYGAIITFNQTDLKRLVAFSSISHMGFVLVGISSVGGFASTIGLTGAALQMFTHGTITGLLFLTVGMIYEKTHTRYIPDLGGLATRMPIAALTLVIAGFASLGLPGTSGFVAELAVFLGAFSNFPWHTGIAAFGVVLSAGYILWMIQRTMFGPIKEQFVSLTDVNKLELIPIALLVITIIGVGVFPFLINDVLVTAISPIVESLHGL